MNDVAHPAPAVPRGRTHRPGGRRRGAATVLALAGAVGLTGCTAFMDMTISPDGTYDVTVEMRDTTGAVFDADPDCSPYTDPSVIGAPEGTKVSAEKLTGEDGSGCLVTITGVTVPDAATEPATGSPTDAATAPSTASSPLVVRDGDLFRVTLPPLMADDDASGSDATGTQATDASGSFDALTEARVSVTFPGAVVDDGGGSVSGSTVTWTDADTIADGVTASGYATQGEGTSAWEGARLWVAGALVAAGAGLGLAVWRRSRRRSVSRR